MTERRYIRPTALDRAFNAILNRLTALGISVYGSRVLAIRGRTSGKWRTVPVNLLMHEDQHYLVAPRGETEWVRNLRAAGGGELRLGRHRNPFRATEVADADKPAVLRAYLDRWYFEVGRFFTGIGRDAPISDLQRIAPFFPVFTVHFLTLPGSVPGHDVAPTEV